MGANIGGNPRSNKQARDFSPMSSKRRAIALAVCMVVAGGASGQDRHAEARARLLRTIESNVRELESSIGRSRLSERVVRAMEKVPRHKFVPPALVDRAYENRPLPIGLDQTISQPFIVALMTDLLDPQPGHRVLEVGTGSGYQAAVLAECVEKVYSIEILKPLADRARALLVELGYRNVEVRAGDGYAGWPDVAPFDGIIVTAAPDHVPPALVEQLRPGGRMVIPVGAQSDGQDLLVVQKDASGKIASRKTLPVRFVPLTRER